MAFRTLGSPVVLLTCALLLIASAERARAVVSLPSLVEGETYSFLFVTSTGTTGDLTFSDYEAFATTHGEGSALESAILSAFGLPSVDWLPLLNHLDGTNYANLNPAYPSSSTHGLYNSRGELSAANHADLWDDGVLALVHTESGDVSAPQLVWSGGNSAGVPAQPLGPGGFLNARSGNTLSAAGWFNLFSSSTPKATSTLPIYVISEALVYTELPEPSMPLLTIWGGLLLARWGRCTRACVGQSRGAPKGRGA